MFANKHTLLILCFFDHSLSPVSFETSKRLLLNDWVYFAENWAVSVEYLELIEPLLNECAFDSWLVSLFEEFAPIKEILTLVESFKSGLTQLTWSKLLCLLVKRAWVTWEVLFPSKDGLFSEAFWAESLDFCEDIHLCLGDLCLESQLCEEFLNLVRVLSLKQWVSRFYLCYSHCAPLRHQSFAQSLVMICGHFRRCGG